MSWVSTRNSIYAITVISAVLILFGRSLGIDITRGILNSPLSFLYLIAIGQLYIVWALWSKYI